MSCSSSSCIRPTNCGLRSCSTTWTRWLRICNGPGQIRSRETKCTRRRDCCDAVQKSHEYWLSSSPSSKLCCPRTFWRFATSWSRRADFSLINSVSWRLRHIQLDERIIGIRMGTGGSAGASYLKHTLDKKFFPELWEARTLLTE